MRRLLLIAAFLGLAACAPERYYLYRPAEQATATLAGRRAARYGIPPESPRGSARVASLGITSVRTSSGEVRTLHVRLALANNNDTGAWEIDARQMRVVYAGGAPVGPAFVNTHVVGEPIVQIPPSEAACIDAYYLLPRGAEGAEGVPRFDLLWEVHTPERTVAERTPFDRITIEPEVETRASWVFGVGPGWWYDPVLYPWGPFIITPPPRVYIGAPPWR
jgi:hypothetical protein